MKQVRYIFPVSHHYRLPFHERLREKLAALGVEYRVVYSEPPLENRLKRDTVDIPWGLRVPMRTVGDAVYQRGLREALGADLVIIQQENKLLLNYLLQLFRHRNQKVAFFGHGRNFQARDRTSYAERWKQAWATRVDWWFGYTDETRRHIESLGFPADRITVFNNAVDTSALQQGAAALSEAGIDEEKAALGVTSDRVAIFVGGLYPDKRLDFLIEAADLVRARIPDFQLIVIGAGVDRPKLDTLAAERSWLLVAGARFGYDKIALMLAAKLFVMPGLVGLAILDAGAVGLPMVTTNYPWHSPEIAYLRDGENGVIVEDWQDVDAYARAVGDLLLDDKRRQVLADGARATASRYTIEAMSERFADGVMAALNAPALKR